MTNDGRTLRTTAGQDDFALHSSHCPTYQFFKKGSNSMQQNQRYFFFRVKLYVVRGLCVEIVFRRRPGKLWEMSDKRTKLLDPCVTIIHNKV